MGVWHSALYSGFNHYHVKGTKPEKQCVLRKKKTWNPSVKKYHCNSTEGCLTFKPEVEDEPLKFTLQTAWEFVFASQQHSCSSPTSAVSRGVLEQDSDLSIYVWQYWWGAGTSEWCFLLHYSAVSYQRRFDRCLFCIEQQAWVSPIKRWEHMMHMLACWATSHHLSSRCSWNLWW